MAPLSGRDSNSERGPLWLDFEVKALASLPMDEPRKCRAVIAFFDYCAKHPQSPGLARDGAQFQQRMSAVIRDLLVGPQCPRSVFLGALALYKAGDLGGLSLVPGAGDDDETWAHHLARYGASEGESEGECGPAQGRGSHASASMELSDRFRALSEAGFSLSRESEGVLSPLSVAVDAGNWVALDAMLEAGAKPQCSSDGEPLLHRAASRQDADVLTVLLRYTENLEVRDAIGRTALHVAIENAVTAPLSVLLEKIAAIKDPEKVGALINAPDLEGRTPIHYAAEAGNPEVAEVLFRLKGARLDRADCDGTTPMHLAVCEEHVDVVELLLAKGVSANVRGGADWTPLHEAAARDHMELIEVLCKAGADVAAITHDGETPLHLAVINGAERAVKSLLSRGARPDVVDEQGYTPITRAACAGEQRILEALFAKLKALEPSMAQQAFEEAMEAARHVHMESRLNPQKLAQRLRPRKRRRASSSCDRGIQEKRRVGQSQLHIAAAAGKLADLPRLLQYGCPINAVTLLGETPLLAALRRDQSEVVAFLLQAGADPLLGLPREISLLSAAAMQGADKTVQMLLNSGKVWSLAAIDDALFIADKLGHGEMHAQLLAARFALT